MYFLGYYNTEFPRFFLENSIIDELCNYRACPCIAIAHQRLDFHSLNFRGASLMAPYVVASKILSRTSFVRQVMDFSKVGLDKSVFEKCDAKARTCLKLGFLATNSQKVQHERQKILLFLQVILNYGYFLYSFIFMYFRLNLDFLRELSSCPISNIMLITTKFNVFLSISLTIRILMIRWVGLMLALVA